MKLLRKLVRRIENEPVLVLTMLTIVFTDGISWQDALIGVCGVITRQQVSPVAKGGE